MNRGPFPSHLCFLSSLPSRHVDDKIRFLGCVTAYSTGTACITVGHLYPRGTNVSVTVDVELLLETLAAEATRTGEWVNVVGYIKAISRGEEGRGGQGQEPSAHVQALMVWPAGPMDIQKYEASLEEMTKMAGEDEAYAK